MGKFGPNLLKFGPNKFFFEIWASSLFLTYLRLVSCKKSKKSYENNGSPKPIIKKVKKKEKLSAETEQINDKLAILSDIDALIR